MAETFLEVGDKLKNIKVTLTDGTQKKLGDLSGDKGLILYFYPKDNTPGCTKEACNFNDNLAALEKAGYNVVGVSKDSVKSHQSFTEKYELRFPLISDEATELIQEAGVWQEKKNYGKTYMGIVRSTYVLDPKLKVKKVYKKVKTTDHADTLMVDLEEL